MPRAVSSALGVLLVTALTLVLAAVAGVAIIATVPSTGVSPADVPEPVVLSASATVDDGTGRVVLVHDGGPDLDVREIEVRISVGGTQLEHQPPVPFYSASGYGSFPSGPFNPVSDPRWERGERAGLVITGENAAPIVPGVSVGIEIYRNDLPIAAVETTASRA